MTQRKSYPTDITNQQWQILAPLIPQPKTGGRPRSIEIREVINAIFYILTSGCAWRRLLPVAGRQTSNSVQQAIAVISGRSVRYAVPCGWDSKARQNGISWRNGFVGLPLLVQRP